MRKDLSKKYRYCTTSIVFILFILEFSFIIQTTNADQVETILTQSADSYVDAFSPLSNFGGSESLYLSYSASAVQVIWLKYDLSEGNPTPIAEGAEIDSAILRIFPYISLRLFKFRFFLVLITHGASTQ
jgi:hypothetical protein